VTVAGAQTVTPPSGGPTSPSPVGGLMCVLVAGGSVAAVILRHRV
jgi:hypothetical protein